MSRKFRKHYDNFSRTILSEFMSNDELNELDRRYTEAKLERLTRKIHEELRRAK